MILFTFIALLAQDPVPLQDRIPIQAPTRRSVPQERLLLRSYSVEDLTLQAETSRLQNDLLRYVGQVTVDAESVRREHAAYMAMCATARDAMADIQSIVKASLQPVFDEDRHFLEALPDSQLLLLGSVEQHAWLQSYLDSCREFEGLLHVKAEIVSLPAGSLNSLIEERSGQVIPNTAAESILREAKGIAGAEVIQVSTMAIPPFRKGNMITVNQVAYVQDFELLVIPELKTEIIDPVIGMIQEGTEMEVSVTPIQDGRFALNAYLQHSVLQRPIRSFDTSIGPEKLKVQVQLPEVLISRLRGKFELGLDEKLVIASRGPDGDQELLMLMSVQTEPYQNR